MVHGRLFAEDYIAGIVYYVTSSGNTVWATGLGSFNESMLDIAYDQFSASLLVSGYTEVVSQIPSMGIVNTFATGFSVPAGIAIDTNQNIYVAEAATGKVWKFTAVSPLPSINSGSSGTCMSERPRVQTHSSIRVRWRLEKQRLPSRDVG